MLCNISEVKCDTEKKILFSRVYLLIFGILFALLYNFSYESFKKEQRVLIWKAR